MKRWIATFGSARWRRKASPLALAAVVVLLTAAAPSASAGASSRPIGQLVVAAGRVLTVEVTPAHTVRLAALDPATGRALWTLPYSTSATTPGVFPVPAVTDGIVVDLAPVAGAANPVVEIRGVDARTGAIRWTLPGRGLVVDYPSTCAGGPEICVAVSENPSGATLLVLDALTGQVVRQVPGVERAMDEAGLYQTTARAATLEQLGAVGNLRWRRTIAALFGAGASPSGGWNFHQQGRIVLGGVGTTTTGIDPSTGAMGAGGATENLARMASAGIDAATGTLVWRARGAYQCMGILEMLKTPVLCRFSGRLHYASRTSTAKPIGVTLLLEGLNPRTGAVTWHTRVLDFRPFFGEGPLPFRDASHLVVRTPAGLRVLDTTTGATSAVLPGTTFWCETLGSYDVVSYSGDYSHGHRASAPAFTGCTASGARVAAVPKSRPTTVGVRVSRRFVWLSPRGLRSAA